MRHRSDCRGRNRNNCRIVSYKSKKISSHPERDLFNSVLKVRNASVKDGWVKREEELSVICIKVVIKGKGRAESVERGSVHDEK